jgi:hypothetical protein
MDYDTSIRRPDSSVALDGLLPTGGNLLWRLRYRIRMVRSLVLDQARRRDLGAAKRYALAMTTLADAYDDRYRFLLAALRQDDGLIDGPVRAALRHELLTGLGLSSGDWEADGDVIALLGGMVTPDAP